MDMINRIYYMTERDHLDLPESIAASEKVEALLDGDEALCLLNEACSAYGLQGFIRGFKAAMRLHNESGTLDTEQTTKGGAGGMTDAGQFIESLRGFDNRHYAMNYGEYSAILEATQMGQDHGGLALLAYRCGLKRGQNMEKNRRKRTKTP